MIEITKIYEFEAAHRLPYHKGLCNHLHGHSYRLEVTVKGPVYNTKNNNGEKGMVMDFSNLKAMIKKIAPYDHVNLNDHFPNPTAETMVYYIAETMVHFLGEKYPEVKLTKVKLWETRTSYATWRPAQ